MYDLIVKGGRVIDPSQNIDDDLDIAISESKISLLSKGILAPEGQRIIDAKGKIVTPGLIDIHCHVYDSIFKRGAEPDAVGVKQAVTTVVDAGSAGHAIFGGFPKYVIPAAQTTVLCFLNLASTGLTIQPELRDWDSIDTDAIKATIECNQDIVKGIKIRLVGNMVKSNAVELIQIAKTFGLPIMMHIGDTNKQVPPTLTQEILPLMESGDILSHVFTSQQGGTLRFDGTVMPELRKAMERGVVLDISHGRFNLSYEVARKSMSQGILPTTLSTDVSLPSLAGPVYGLTVTMSKFMALGLDLKQVIEMTTINPACALGEESRMGSLKPGMNADISILELLSGTWRMEDSEHETIEATRLIAPRMTIKLGKLIPAQPVAQPQPIA